MLPESPKTSFTHMKKQQKPSTKANLSFTSEKPEQMSTQSTQAPQLSVGEELKLSFDEELEWCIAQLQLGLLRKDASKTQKQENERHIKTLNSKAPPPRKRQLMRNLFGDYRAKMKKEPLSHGSQKPEISSVEKETLEATGKFYKESVSHIRPGMQSSSAACSGDSSEAVVVTDLITGGSHDAEPFYFNFEIEPDS